MLEQLIESKSNAKANKTRGGFILTTFLLVTTLCFSAVLSSLFAMNLGIGGEDLELSALVMPLAPDTNKPEPVEPAPKQEKQSPATETETTRNANVLRLDESPTVVPNEISNVPNTQKARPNVPFKITNGLEKDAASPQGNSNRVQNEVGTGIGEKTESTVAENIDKEDAPVLTKKIVEPRKTLVSGGVVNSQATSLPKPAYPQAALAVNAKGAVNVQVTIDEKGNVISAKAVSGHPLLRDASEKAARIAKFTPTILSGQPVKVTGVIIYNFAR